MVQFLMSEVTRAETPAPPLAVLREIYFFIDILLVRIRFIIEMIWWTGLAPWGFEFAACSPDTGVPRSHEIAPPQGPP